MGSFVVGENKPSTSAWPLPPALQQTFGSPNRADVASPMDGVTGHRKSHVDRWIDSSGKGRTCRARKPSFLEDLRSSYRRHFRRFSYAESIAFLQPLRFSQCWLILKFFATPTVHLESNQAVHHSRR